VNVPKRVGSLGSRARAPKERAFPLAVIPEKFLKIRGDLLPILLIDVFAHDDGEETRRIIHEIFDQIVKRLVLILHAAHDAFIILHRHVEAFGDMDPFDIGVLDRVGDRAAETRS
jgi:hypothetical protein